MSVRPAILPAVFAVTLLAACSRDEGRAPPRVEDPQDDTVSNGEGWLHVPLLYPTRDDLDDCSEASPKSQCAMLAITAGTDHRATVVDQYLTSMKVRVLDGPAMGKEGWCNKPCLHKKTIDPQGARPTPPAKRGAPAKPPPPGPRKR